MADVFLVLLPELQQEIILQQAVNVNLVFMEKIVLRPVMIAVLHVMKTVV